MWSPEREAEAPAGGDSAGLLPPEWEEDEERMSFLFSAFKRSREVNSTDWDSKMGFWAPLVLSHSRRQGVVRLRLRDLQEAFQRKGSVPLGLATVLQDLLRRGELQRESDFMASVDSSWISWGVGVFLLKPLKWTLSNMLGDNKVPAEEVLVAVELLKEKAEEVYRLYQNSPLSSHPVVALAELSTLCANSCPDERTFYLVLLQLQKEKRVTVLEQNGEKIVKFARGPHAKVSPVNDVDVGVYQLMQSEQLLSRKVESLSQEAERCKEEARRACRAGKKQLALRSLKARQRTEKRIEALHAKLDTVQGILDRIYASQTDQMVFHAYQAGVGALKLSMKDVTVEKAESLVDQIQETLTARSWRRSWTSSSRTPPKTPQSCPTAPPRRSRPTACLTPGSRMPSSRLSLRNCLYRREVWSQAVNLQKGNWHRLSEAITGPSCQRQACVYVCVCT
ncbi:charged multivesicular body protein 7 isoform X2 [Ochotona curzoniae]|uniref:charged multivesicular body protein 7 isoform X2 n=1 Tax=Ochotona curzoniae TaxID=130825 RepID=UPI001B34AA57|nr:charged multivesicular body protein 7 isoform X2 [Ochotona curzoniae]XP_040852222.1 charged multivesicular body protein 7 isoform X2 [Ochotona curzoniae]